MNAKRWTMGLLLGLLASATVQAEDCRPQIEAAWVREAPPGVPSLAGYLSLQNGCDAAVQVVDVESLDFGRPMIHRTEHAGGVSRMRPVGELVVEPGAALRFEPGGLHLMLMRPNRRFVAGDVVRFRLVLADGRRLYVEAPVRREAP